MTLVYLESLWEKHSIKYTHARYWFRNVCNFEQNKNSWYGQMDGETNGHVQSYNNSQALRQKQLRVLTSRWTILVHKSVIIICLAKHNTAIICNMTIYNGRSNGQL